MRGQPQPLVSILIPCYNAGQWVRSAVESALGQTYPNTEILVFDDGSTDQSLEVLRSFGDRIQLDSGPNRGGNVTRNRLLQAARGEWIQYLDADDFLYGDKIDRQVDFLLSQSGVDVVYGPVTFERRKEDGSVSGEVAWLPATSHDPWVLLARWTMPQTGSPLWRRQAINDVGGWRDDQPCCQEHELYFRLLAAGKVFRHLPVPGAVYRQWSTDTVCRRDEDFTRIVRLGILDQIEEFLRDTDQLTEARLHSLNLTRFESARLIWLRDREAAGALMKDVVKKEPHFKPSGPAAPSSYRLAFQLGGFSAAEKLAALRRRMSPSNVSSEESSAQGGDE